MKQKAIRKTYTLTELDIALIEEVKDRLLNKKQVVTDSQVIRMGLAILNACKEADLLRLAQEVPALTKKAAL